MVYCPCVQSIVIKYKRGLYILTDGEYWYHSQIIPPADLQVINMSVQNMINLLEQAARTAVRHHHLQLHGLCTQASQANHVLSSTVIYLLKHSHDSVLRWRAQAQVYKYKESQNDGSFGVQTRFFFLRLGGDRSPEETRGGCSQRWIPIPVEETTLICVLSL
jgi:hypothetical protein